MPKIVQIGMGGSDVASPPTELTDNLNPALLFESTDGADYLTISTTDNAEGVTVTAPSPGAQNSNTGFTVNAGIGGNIFRASRNGASGSGNVIFMDSGTNNIKVLGTGTQFNTTNSITTHLGTSDDYWVITDDGDADILRITQTGNFTHTLSDASDSVFKVVDDADPVITYLSITQGDVSSLGHSSDSTATHLRGSSVQLRPSNESIFAANANGDARLIFLNGSGTMNAVTNYGTKQDYTANTSEGDEELQWNRVYELAASGPSGDVTVDADFFTVSGLDTTAVQAAQESTITVVNSNATHNFIFKFNMKSGEGAVAALDADSLNLTDGTGYVCAPGKVARFRIETVRIGGTADTNQVHMISCLGKSQNTFSLRQGKGADTATTQAVYLANTAGNANDTLIIDFSNGNVGDVTLTRNIDKIRFYNVPPDGLASSVTARITQGGSAYTISYADADVTCYDDVGTTTLTGEIKFSGGVHHTQSTGSGDVDIVSFTSIPAGSTFDIYGAVIGQDFS